MAKRPQGEGSLPDYYALLSLSPRRNDTALTPPEVKKAYKRALLQHHPDKQKDSTSPVSIDDLALAAKILSTPSLKATYDRGLRTAATRNNSGEDGKVFHTGLETTDLDDLVFEENQGIWKRGCRCGDPDGFLVRESDLDACAEDGEFVTGCRGCSLWLRVLFGFEEG